MGTGRRIYLILTPPIDQLAFFGILMRNDPPLMPSGSKQSVEDGVKGCCIPLAFLAAQMADGPLVDF